MTPETWHELRRKGIHMTTSLVPLAYGLGAPRAWVLALFAVFTVVMLASEAIRHGDHAAGRLFRRVFEPMMREKERSEAGRRRWLGATPYCIASLLVVWLFPKPVAVLSLLYLAVGDTAASLVGRVWGRTRIMGKSLEGAAGFFCATALVALAAHALSSEYPLWPAIGGALAAALAELLIPRVDDNFSIPFAAALAMTALA